MAEAQLSPSPQPAEGKRREKRKRKKSGGAPGQQNQQTRQEKRETFLAREATRIMSGDYKAVRRVTIDGSIFADLASNHDNLIEQFRKKASSREGASITLKMQEDVVKRSEALADQFNLLNAEMTRMLGWEYIPPRNMPNPLLVVEEKTATTAPVLPANAVADIGKPAGPVKAAA